MVMWTIAIRREVGIDDQANDAGRAQTQPRSTASMPAPAPVHGAKTLDIDDPAPNSSRPSPSAGCEEDQHIPIFSRHVNFLNDALANGISLVSCVG